MVPAVFGPVGARQLSDTQQIRKVSATCPIADFIALTLSLDNTAQMQYISGQ